MNRKFNTLSTVTMLFAGVASAHGLPISSEAASSEEAMSLEVPPGLLSAMRRDLGGTEEQLRRRLVFEAKAPGLERRLSQELGDTFGGAWLTAEGTQLIVGVTDAASAEHVRRAGGEPRRVARSQARLDQVVAELNAHARNAPSSIHSWYVDLPTNSVVVQLDDSSVSRFRAEAFIAHSSGAKDGTIRLVASTEAPQLAYDVRGGDPYYFDGYRCSIGFPVEGGFVTAGHCGSAGTAVTDTNSVSMGAIRASNFPTTDYGWVATHSAWTPQPWVYNYNSANISVSGSEEASVGASICRSGYTTGWRCGTLLAKNATAYYAQGAVYGLHKTSACADRGDSGGSVLSGNQAQGVTSGISGACGSSNPETYYQPINPILSTYGLKLRTGGKAFVSRFNSKCMDVPNANFADGVQLQMWSCNGTSAQHWTFVGNTVRLGGKCLDVSGANTANGTAVQLWSCNGTAAQDFTLTSTGELVSHVANKCVDIREIDPNDGAKVHIWDCLGISNQKWDYR
ncbi:trypsin-like serine protease [Cystobacter fuscus]|uniref:ricin-type beta-trefoil lectin domain protein n=1 Tax=Cystobacter fuscus TaxID=43 RepID=UPI002B317890|nr:trypsin-like serine protease [Cystobacter fuscus]